jgi:hypothetical protein
MASTATSHRREWLKSLPIFAVAKSIALARSRKS